VGRAERHLFLYRLKRGLRRLDLRAPAARAAVARRRGIGFIVGIGMAAFAPLVAQSPLLLGLLGGLGAPLMILFSPNPSR
jgi:hypothetical protein